MVFSVHMPNGSGNGWAKIDAFEALATALEERPTGACVIAGDFNEPFRFEADAVVSFAYQHGEHADALWRRRGTHTPVREYPRRKWQDAVGRVLGGDIRPRRSAASPERWLLRTRITCDHRWTPRLFDHILVSEGIRSPGVTYDTSVLGGEGHTRLSDHAIVIADLSIE